MCVYKIRTRTSLLQFAVVNCSKTALTDVCIAILKRRPFIDCFPCFPNDDILPPYSSTSKYHKKAAQGKHQSKDNQIALKNHISD